MDSMIRCDQRASSIGQEHRASALSGASASLAAFRVHVDTEYAHALSLLIESEIIPRLMVAYACPDMSVPAPVDGNQGIHASEIEAFAPLVMQIEADTLLAHIETILARGISFDTVMVDLLAPTARRLGELWEDDRCDFVDVTMGLWRLQEVVHEIALRVPAGRTEAASARSALFASMPGDQHNFGTVVIEEIFRHDGWRTERISGVQTADLLRCVAHDWFDMIGLTISCDCHIAETASIIAALRNVSRNSQVCVMVGGRIFSEDPTLAAHVGADGTARDAKAALRVAADLVRSREREVAA